MRTLFMGLSIFIATATTAGESQIRLKDGPGKNNIVSQCNMCHSLDYISMHAKILDRAGWEKTVDKMIKVMGAPINETEKQMIIDYLAKYYGK